MTNRRTDYRVGRLSAERIALFENEFPDWQWRKQDAAFAVAFETGLAHLRRYVAAHGTSNARRATPSTDSLSAPGSLPVAPTTAKAD